MLGSMGLYPGVAKCLYPRAGARNKDAYVFQGTDDTHNVYENPRGGVFAQAFLNYVIQEGSDKSLKRTVGYAFDKIKSITQKNAEALDGRKQIPQMLVCFDAREDMPFYHLGMYTTTVIILCPSYSEDMELPGAEQDVLKLLSCAEKFFATRCQFKVLMTTKSVQDLQGLVGLYQKVTVEEPTQINFKSALNQAKMSGENVALFVFAHGEKYVTPDGRVDEYIVFPNTPSITGEVVDGKYMGQVFEDFSGEMIWALHDLCKGGGIPNQHEVKGKVVCRGSLSAIPQQGSLSKDQLFVEAEMMQFLARALVYHSQGLCTPYMRQLVLSFQMDTMKRLPRYCWSIVQDTLSSAGTHTPSAPVLMDQACGQPVGFDSSVVKANPTHPENLQLQVSAGTAGVKDRGLLDDIKAECGKLTDDVSWLATRLGIKDPSAFYNKGVRYAGELWNSIEAGLVFFCGTTFKNILGPVALLSVAFLGITFFSGMMLYLHYVMRNPISTLTPVFLVMVLTTLGPYLCDPEFVQHWLSYDSSFVWCTWTFLVSLLTVLFFVMVNYDRLKTLDNVKKFMSWSVGYLKHSKTLFAMGVNMYFYDKGSTVQQTMKIRVGGVESFVLYYPLRKLNNGSKICAIPAPKNGKYVVLWDRTAYSMLDREVNNGLQADFTCNYDVFRLRVALRSKNNPDNLATLSFLEGQRVLNLTDFHADTEYIQQLLKSGSDFAGNADLMDAIKTTSAWKSGSWAEAFEGAVTGKKHNRTWLEWAAMPWLAFVSRCMPRYWLWR